MMKKLMGLLMLAAGFCGTLHAATKGSCESAAAEIDFKGIVTRTVRLTAEYFPEDEGGGTYDPNSGTYYFKATLKRSQAYTVWTEGVSTNDEVSVNCYAADPKSDDEFGPSADFTELEESAGNQRFILFADDWWIDDEDPKESDPKSWTYYFQISGNVGDSVTINFQPGAVIPTGREERPRSISPNTTPITISSQLELGGEYYLRARLLAGRLYSFGVSGGSEAALMNVLVVNDDSTGSTGEEGGGSDLVIYADPAYDNDDYNAGIYVIPSETDYYTIIVDGMGDNEAAPFGLTYRLLPDRPITAHPATPLTAGNLHGVECKPGYKSKVSLGFYDQIIDESLFSFSAIKGGRYLVETEGAATNLLMRVYDEKGKVLCENTGDGTTFNVRGAFAAPAAGTYYVGVCQNLYDEFVQEPAYLPVRVKLLHADALANSPDAWDAADDEPAGAAALSPQPGTAADDPAALDAAGNGPHELGATDWTDVFMIAGRKGVTYALTTTVPLAGSTANTLKAEVFTLSGAVEKAVAATGDINPGAATPLTFTASVHATYYVRLSVAQGQGLEFPPYKVHAKAYTTTGAALGILTVNTHGTTLGAFSLGSETVKYPGGNSVLVSGSQTVKFVGVPGFATPAAKTVTVTPGTTPTVVDVYYRDTFDPKDDRAAGAVALALKNVPTRVARTLWTDDAEDCFSFAAKDGQYYDLALADVTGDAVFSITNAAGGVFAQDVTSVSQLVLPAAKTKYYLTVRHGTQEKVGGGYALEGFVAAVGAIQFAKPAVNAKENAARVVLTVNRTAKDGRVRVRYGTVAGTAQPGVDYVPQTGELEWAANDNKAKTITVALIPDLVPVYEGDKTFGVELRAIPEDEREADEYPATLGASVCTVTLTEVSKAGTTAAAAYAAKAPKLATVKTEAVALNTGAFYGVLAEDGCALTNGLPKLASLTFTASTATPSALSAKVQLGGKAYTFSAKGWDFEDGGLSEKVFTLAQRVNGVTYTNTLTVTLPTGATAKAGDWLKLGGEAELVMNVPDANGKGVQEDIRYLGSLFRQNAKIQDYFTAVTNFTGYYTVALAPDAWVGSGVPAGNGYLTLTLDNKGTAKVAGQLADATKVSLSVPACAILPDEGSANGYALAVPLYLAKAPYCFGGELRLFAQADGKVVVDASRTLAWYNDNKALTYFNEDGFQIELTPVGGWYDQVVNLQAYYLKHALEVETADLTEFPTEGIASGFEISTEADPNGLAVTVLGDVFSTAKKTALKNGKLTDLAASTNICNVQVKLARATGLVTGSFSVWSETPDGAQQKEVAGLKHNGVLLLSRDAHAPMSDEILSAGFFTQAVTVVDEDPDTGKKTNRKWNFSAPFNILGIDQGDIDWWADDWGEQP